MDRKQLKPLFLLSRGALISILLAVSAAGQGQVSVNSVPNINNLRNAAYCSDTSVSANTITCSTPVGFTGYAAGQAIDVLLANSVTGATTVNVNALGAKSVTYNGTNALTSATGLVAGGTYRLEYDGTRFVLQGVISAGGACPAGSAGQVQFYVSAGVCGGDSNLTWDNATKTFAIGTTDLKVYTSPLATPAAPVVTAVGTPGTTEWDYKLVCINSVGETLASAEGAVLNGNDNLDGTNKNSIATIAGGTGCASYDVYRTGTGSSPSTFGLIGNVTAGSSLVDSGLPAVGYSSAPPINTTQGTNGLRLTAGQTPGALRVGTSLTSYYEANGFDFPSNSPLVIIKYQGDGTDMPVGILATYEKVNGSPGFGRPFVFQAFIGDSGDSFLEFATTFSANNTGVHDIAQLINMYSVTSIQASGNIDQSIDYYATGYSVGSGSIHNLYGYWGANLAAATTSSVVFYAEEQTGGTNQYYSWFDSRGVLRTKEDSTFDSVGQAITALYNPQFAKYTPGATDFERCIPGGQWNGNVCEIGTEKGGSGTLRNLRLIGTQVLVNSLKTTGAATGKTVVCVDTSTGQLYASSSGVACAN